MQVDKVRVAIIAHLRCESSPPRPELKEWLAWLTDPKTATAAEATEAVGQGEEGDVEGSTAGGDGQELGLLPCEPCSGRMGADRLRCTIWGGEATPCEDLESWIESCFPRRSPAPRCPDSCSEETPCESCAAPQVCTECGDESQHVVCQDCATRASRSPAVDEVVLKLRGLHSELGYDLADETSFGVRLGVLIDRLSQAAPPLKRSPAVDEVVREMRDKAEAYVRLKGDLDSGPHVPLPLLNDWADRLAQAGGQECTACSIERATMGMSTTEHTCDPPVQPSPSAPPCHDCDSWYQDGECTLPGGKDTCDSWYRDGECTIPEPSPSAGALADVAKEMREYMQDTRNAWGDEKPGPRVPHEKMESWLRRLSEPRVGEVWVGMKGRKVPLASEIRVRASGKQELGWGWRRVKVEYPDGAPEQGECEGCKLARELGYDIVEVCDSVHKLKADLDAARRELETATNALRLSEQARNKLIQEKVDLRRELRAEVERLKGELKQLQDETVRSETAQQATRVAMANRYDELRTQVERLKGKLERADDERDHCHRLLVDVARAVAEGTTHDGLDCGCVASYLDDIDD